MYYYLHFTVQFHGGMCSLRQDTEWNMALLSLGLSQLLVYASMDACRKLLG